MRCLFAETSKTGNATSSERIERTSGDGVDTNILLTQLVGQVAYATFQSRLRDSHHIVFRHNTLTRHIGQRENAATTVGFHQWFGALCHRNERISTDIYSSMEASASRL